MKFVFLMSIFGSSYLRMKSVYIVFHTVLHITPYQIPRVFYFAGMKNDTENLHHRRDISFKALPLLKMKIR